MIRYPILDEENEQSLDAKGSIRKAHKRNLRKVRKAEIAKLKKLIKARKRTWLTKAEERTETYRTKKEYFEPPSGNWSQIKEVYKQLQFNKCAYCEQKLEDRGIAHDVEHYRPKKQVLEWLNDARKNELGFEFNDKKDKGYHLLPYNIFNYVTSCKVCNSNLKRNYFPIAGNRRLVSDKEYVLKREKPFLIYPLGSADENIAEDLISFHGYLPVVNPGLTDEHKKKRAKINIKLFELDLRPYLIKQRCEVIEEIFEAIETIAETQSSLRKERAGKKIERLQKGNSEHANCARSFFNLCMENPDEAFDLYIKAVEYIENNPTT